MNRKTLLSVVSISICLLFVLEAIAQDPVENTNEEIGETNEVEEPASEEESEVEAWVPTPPPEEEEYEESTYEELPVVDNRPYAKGDMELGFGLGGMGGSGFFSLSVGARFNYYVVPRLAPGISLNYQTIWGDLEYPQSLTTLPYLKFVLIRSRRFAPYLIAAGGREFQWSGTDDATQGYAAIDSWIVGGGIGMHIGIGSNFALMIQVLFLYYFFDESVLIAGESNPVDGHLYTPISIGMSIFF